LILISTCHRTFVDKFKVSADVIERRKVKLVEVCRVLNGDDVFASEWFVSDEILPEVWLDV